MLYLQNIKVHFQWCTGILISKLLGFLEPGGIKSCPWSATETELSPTVPWVCPAQTLAPVGLTLTGSHSWAWSFLATSCLILEWNIFWVWRWTQAFLFLSPCSHRCCPFGCFSHVILHLSQSWDSWVGGNCVFRVEQHFPSMDTSK